MKIPRAVILMLLSAAAANATVLIATFNDNNQAVINGQGGGTGFSGNWAGSANPFVTGGDLTSSLYNVPQSGTAQLLRGSNNGAVRQDFRTVATSPTGEVWFSFLTRVDESTSGASTESAGISLNPSSTATPFNNLGNFYVVHTGDTIEYSFGAGTAGTVTGLTGSPVTGGNQFSGLFVGRLVINGGGAADTVTVWYNPNLIANADINTYTPFYNSSAVNALDAISVIGAAVYQSGNLGGGELDNIRFSDGSGNAAQAFMDVTGVPEPSITSMLALLAGVGIILRKRL